MKRRMTILLVALGSAGLFCYGLNRDALAFFVGGSYILATEWIRAEMRKGW